MNQRPNHANSDYYHEFSGSSYYRFTSGGKGGKTDIPPVIPEFTMSRRRSDWVFSPLILRWIKWTGNVNRSSAGNKLNDRYTREWQVLFVLLTRHIVRLRPPKGRFPDKRKPSLAELYRGISYAVDLRPNEAGEKWSSGNRQSCYNSIASSISSTSRAKTHWPLRGRKTFT